MSKEVNNNIIENYNKNKSFNREVWVIRTTTNKEVRYENMRKSLKEMNVLKSLGAST